MFAPLKAAQLMCLSTWYVRKMNSQTGCKGRGRKSKQRGEKGAKKDVEPTTRCLTISTKHQYHGVWLFWVWHSEYTHMLEAAAVNLSIQPVLGPVGACRHLPATNALADTKLMHECLCQTANTHQS